MTIVNMSIVILLILYNLIQNKRRKHTARNKSPFLSFSQSLYNTEYYKHTIHLKPSRSRKIMITEKCMY